MTPCHHYQYKYFHTLVTIYIINFTMYFELDNDDKESSKRLSLFISRIIILKNMSLASLIVCQHLLEKRDVITYYDDVNRVHSNWGTVVIVLTIVIYL